MPGLSPHIETRIVRECVRCHCRWPADWEMCPNCAISLLGTDRPERLVHLVPAGPSRVVPRAGERAPDDEVGGTADEAVFAGTGHGPLVLLACRVRCGSEVVREEDLQAGGEIFRRAMSLADSHGGRGHVVAGVGVIAAWSAEESGVDPALRTAGAIAGAPEIQLDRVRRLGGDGRVSVGIGITSARAIDARERRTRLAFRLADLAIPQAVLVSHGIYAHTVDRFDYQGVSPAVPRSDPLPELVFRLLGPKPERSGTHHAGPERLPLVGRGGGLRMLDACFGEAASGRGIVLHLIGEPGAGKSRLLRAWLAAEPPGRFLRLSSHGVPYGGYAWRTWRELVRPLRATDDEGAPALPPTGPTVAAVLTRVRTTPRPVVIAIDDLHWVDGPSLQAVAELLAGLDDVPAVAILAYRPSFVRHAPGEPRHAQRYLRLRGMRDRAMRTLVEALAACAGTEVPTGIRRRIVQLSRGNPLYAEEAVAYLADVRSDSGLLPPELSASLPDLLIRRIEWTIRHALPDLQQRSRRLTVFGNVAFGGEREAILRRLDALEERLAGWLDRFDVIEEKHDLVDEFVRGLRHLDGELALLSLLLGRQRPHRQRLAQALDRLEALRSGACDRG
jgi:hypothetical protein